MLSQTRNPKLKGPSALKIFLKSSTQYQSCNLRNKMPTSQWTSSQTKIAMSLKLICDFSNFKYQTTSRCKKRERILLLESFKMKLL